MEASDFFEVCDAIVKECLNGWSALEFVSGRLNLLLCSFRKIAIGREINLQENSGSRMLGGRAVENSVPASGESCIYCCTDFFMREVS